MQPDFNIENIKIPPCPWSIVGLTRESQKPEPDMNRIVALISHDPAMTVSMLNAVNSPMFGYSKKISSVNEAIYSIGMTRALSLAFACKVSDLCSNPKALNNIWQHSRAIAEIAAKLYKLSFITEFNANSAYTAGLLHDCGLFLMQDQVGVDRDLSRTDMGMENHFNHHAELGATLLKKWGMADIIVQSAKYHHSIESLSDDFPLEVCKMVALIHLAERVDDLIQHTLNGGENNIPDSCLLALDILDIESNSFLDVQYDLLEDSAT